MVILTHANSGDVTYYTNDSGGEYVEVIGISEFAEGVTYYTKETVDVYTVANKYDEAINNANGYYEKREAGYNTATIGDKIDSLGLVRLDEDNLVVLDLRGGTVKEISLDEIEKDSYVVIYKENGVCRPDTKYNGNVVIVVE